MADHPITPPPELVEQWVQATESNDCIGAFPTNFEKRICTMAARWGSDQELEACCDYLRQLQPQGNVLAEQLWAVCRPKPPSLKERALQAWAAVEAGTDDQAAMAVIRRALEQLDD